MRTERYSGPLAWMAGNQVAANILMLFFLVGGLFWAGRITQEVFPEFSRDEVRISVAYPGASPEEILDGIILPVEEAVSTLDNVAQVESTAVEGNGTVVVEALSPSALDKLADDIRQEVERITTFPDEAEEPSVSIPSRRRSVITLVLYGELSESVLFETAETVRERLLQDPEISQVELAGASPLELSIEIDQDTLRSYGLSLAEVAARIRAASLDLPGGTIKTASGHIQLRMQERRDAAREFESLPIITTEDGSQLVLGDIARVTDGFAETDRYTTYNGHPAIEVEVFRVGTQGPIEIARTVRDHARELESILPDGIHLAAVNDRSQVYRQRLDLLLKNGFFGLVLVLLLLSVFLAPRLAFWVTMGIPVSFLGSLLFLPHLGVSINMISLFAFIVTLGIVVDDTIIVGENVYTYRQKGYSAMEAAILGVREMTVPVTFAVLTNIITFMPLYFIPGVMGKVFRSIPLVVAVVFAISLVEALLVLPAHLGHQREMSGRLGSLSSRFQQRVSNGISRLIKGLFTPSVVLAMRFRYISLAAGLTLLLVTFGYVKSGRLGASLFPRVESDTAYLSFSLPTGSSVDATRQIMDRLLKAADQVIAENGNGSLAQGTMASIDANTGNIRVYLEPPDARPISTGAFIEQWRAKAGPQPGLESLQFRSDRGGPGSGSSLSIELSHRDSAILEQAASELADALGAYPMVSEIEDGFTRGKLQFDFQLNDLGYRLGLTPEQVARQIRASYYGHEVTRQIRGRHEVKIVVRLPEEQRRSVMSLETMMLQVPGGEVPLASVVRVTPGRAFTEINLRDGRRIVTVTGDVTPRRQSQQVLDQVERDVLPVLLQHYPELSYSFAGQQSDRSESIAALQKGMAVALILVYVLLAIVFRSYIQPAIIMAAIPFGVVGAVGGHLLMGYELSLVSFFGIVALSGVVVNDSLVLIDLANRKRLEGQTCYAAVINAAVSRFRPIILTTLTTFFGLMPMIFETSRQARFLIPMAISLGFGILFATAIILVLVPSLYLILDDIHKLLGLRDRFSR